MAMLPLPKETWMEDALRDFPHVSSFLRERGVICVMCGEPVWGTLEEVIKEKNLDVEAIMTEMNAFLINEAGGV